MGRTIREIMAELDAERGGGAAVAEPPQQSRAEYRQRMMGEEDAIIRKREAGQYLTPREERIFQAVAAREAQLARTADQLPAEPEYLARFEGEVPEAFASNTPRVDPGLLERERMERQGRVDVAERQFAVARAARDIPEEVVQSYAQQTGMSPERARIALAQRQVNPSGQIAPLDPGAYGQFIVGPQHALADRIPGIEPMAGVPGQAGQTIAAGALDAGLPIAAGLAAGPTGGASLVGLVGLYGVGRTEKALEQGDDILPAIGKGILTMAVEGTAGRVAAHQLNKIGNATMRRIGEAMKKQNYTKASQIARGALQGAGVGAGEEATEAILETIGENIIDYRAGKITLDEAVNRIGRDALPNAKQGAIMGALAGGVGGGVMAGKGIRDAAKANAEQQAMLDDRVSQSIAIASLNPQNARWHRPGTAPDIATMPQPSPDGVSPNFGQRVGIDGRPIQVPTMPPAVPEQERKRAMTEWARANPEMARTLQRLRGAQPQRADSSPAPTVDKATALAGVQEWAAANPEQARILRESLGDFGLSLYDVPDIDMPPTGPASSMQPTARRRGPAVDLPEAKRQAVRDWAAANPERAAQARELFNPSRNEFRDLQITGKWTAEERAAAMELLRNDAMDRLEGDLRGPVSAAEQFTADQAGETIEPGERRMFGPEGIERPDMPVQGRLPIDLDADPNTAEREAAAQDLFNPMATPTNPEMEAVTAPSEVEPEPEPEPTPAPEPPSVDVPMKGRRPIADLTYNEAKVVSQNLGIPATGGKTVMQNRLARIQRADQEGTYLSEPAKISNAQIKRRITEIVEEFGFGAEYQAFGDADTPLVEGGTPISFTFKGELPTEIIDALSGQPPAVRTMFTVVKSGEPGSTGGADAMDEYGAERLVEIARAIALRGEKSQREAFERVRANIDGIAGHPDADWIAHVYDNAINYAGGGARRSNSTLYFPDRLPAGATFEIEGTEFVVRKDGEAVWGESDSGYINLNAVEAMPYDTGTLNPDANVPESVDEPTDPDDIGIPYNREIPRRPQRFEPRRGLFGQTEFTPATGRQQELELEVERPADAEARRVRGEQPIDDPDQALMPGVVDKLNLPERKAKQPGTTIQYKPQEEPANKRPELLEDLDKPDLPMPAFLERLGVRSKYMGAVANRWKGDDGKPTGYFFADTPNRVEVKIERDDSGTLSFRGKEISRQENQDLYDFVDAWIDWRARNDVVSSKNEKLSRDQAEFDDNASGDVRSAKLGSRTKVVGDAQLVDGTRIVLVNFNEQAGFPTTAAVVLRPGEKASTDTPIYVRRSRDGSFAFDKDNVESWRPYRAPFDAKGAVDAADRVAETIGASQYGVRLDEQQLAEVLGAAGVLPEATTEPASPKPAPKAAAPKPAPKVERSVGALFEQPATPAPKAAPKATPKAKTYPPLPSPPTSAFTEQHALPEGLNKDGSVPLGYTTVDPETGVRAEVVAQKKNAEDGVQVIMQRVYGKDGKYQQSNISLWDMDAQARVGGGVVRGQAKDMDAFNKRAEEFLPTTKKPATKPKPAEPDADIPPTEPGMLFNRELDPNQNAFPVTRDGDNEGVSLDQVMRSAEKIFGLPIRREPRSFKGRTRGFYDAKERIIKVDGKTPHEIGVIVHEIAHDVDALRKLADGKTEAQWAADGLTIAMHELKALDYEVRYGTTDPKDGRAFEGFAEYMRILMTFGEADAARAAPAWHRHFMDNVVGKDAKLERQLGRLQTLINQYRDAGAVGRVKAQIGKAGEVDRGTTGSKWQDAMETLAEWRDNAHRSIANAGLIFEQMMKDAVANGYQGDPRELYQAWMSNLGKTGAYAESSLFGDGLMSARLRRPLARRSLASRLMDHGINHRNRADFEAYVVVRQGLEALRLGQNIGLTEADMRAAKQKLHTPEFEKAAQALTDFNNDLLLMLTDAGVITRQEYNYYKSKYQNYAPLLRLVEGSTIGGAQGANATKAIMKRLGSNAKILSPIEGTVQRAYRFYDIALRHQLIIRSIEIAEQAGGMGEYFSKAPPRIGKTDTTTNDIRGQLVKHVREGLEWSGSTPQQARLQGERMVDDLLDTFDPNRDGWALSVFVPDFRPGTNEIRVVRSGKPQLYTVKPEFLKALEKPQSLWNGNDVGTQLLRFAFLTPAKALRMGAVTANPYFALPNIARDYLTYVMQTEQRTYDPRMWFRPLEAGIRLAMVRASGGRVDDPMMKLYLEMGGRASTLASQNIHSTRASAELIVRQDAKVARRLRAIMASRSGVMKLTAATESVIDSIQQVVSFSDILPRAAEFEVVINKAGYTNEDLRQGNYPPVEVLERAITAAAEITVPFERSGSSPLIESIRQVLPFSGASIQGSTNMTHKALSNPRTRHRIAYLALAQALYFILNKDEDWYKEQDDWLRYGYWTFADSTGTPVVRIPRSLDFGWWVAGTVEQALQAWYDDDPESFTDFAAELVSRTAPSMNNPTIMTIHELIANKDHFRNVPIESQSFQQLPKPMRYTDRTSWLARELGERFNMSPVMIDHVLTRATGGMSGRLGQVKAFTDKVKRGDSITLGDVPVVGVFGFRTEYGKSQGDFYDAMNEATLRYNGERKKILDKDPSLSNAEVLKKVDAATRREYFRYQRFKNLLNGLRSQMYATNDSDKAREIMKVILGTSRAAIGEEQLDRFKPAWKSDTAAAKAAMEGWFGEIVATGSSKSNINADEAIKIVREMALPRETVQSLVRTHLRDRYKTFDTRREYYQRFFRRYDAE